LAIAMTPQLGMACPSFFANPSVLGRKGCGSGPYELTNQRQSGADFRRVPNYWDKAVDARAPEQLTVFGVADQNARINGLVSGQYDAISLFAATQGDVKAIPSSRFQTVAVDPANRFYELGFNTSKPPLNDPRVWRAVSLALDRKGISSLYAKGGCVPTAQMGTPGTAGYVKALDNEKVWGQNLKEAKRLMAEAGQADGFSVNMISLTTFQQLNAAVQAELAQIGIDVKVDAIPTGLVPGWLTGRYKMAVLAYAGSLDLSGVAGVAFNPSQTIGPIPSPLTEFVSAAGSQPLGSKGRDQTWQSFNRYLVATPRNVVICATSEIKVGSKKVTGLANPGLGSLSAVLDMRYLGLTK
jgi:ABC-type transport system substrate-binding protein